MKFEVLFVICALFLSSFVDIYYVFLVFY